MVWGAGFFGQKWLETAKARPDCTVAGIVSRTPSRVEALRRDLGLDAVPSYPAIEDALQRGHADAVIVALPQMFHRAAIISALDAGLHVLTEKPLAMTIDEARAILEASRTHPDRVVMVNQNFRWRPHTQALRRALVEGAIGRPGHLTLDCRQQIRRTTIDGWREAMADPYLLDFAIHHFDLIRYVCGDEPGEVIATSFRPAWSWLAGDTAALAIVTMENGLVVDYGGTMVSQGLETPQEGVITVIGDQGTLRLDARSQVVVAGRGEPRVFPQTAIPEGELGHALAQFLDAVRNGRRPETHVEDNVRSFAFVAAAIESTRARRPIRPAELLSGG